MYSLTTILLEVVFFLSFIYSKPSEDNALSRRQTNPNPSGMTPAPQGRVMIGYYLNLYAKYQPASDLPWSQYTDMVYFGARPMENLQFTFGSDEQNQLADANMRQFASMAPQKNVRPLFGIGGEQGSTLFSYYLATAELRQRFVQSLVSLAQGYGFAGVAVSWEFPTDIGIGCNTRSANDVPNLGFFAQEFKKQWSAGRLVIRSSLRGFVGAAGKVAESNEIGQLAQNVDYIDLMGYDAFTGNKGKNSGPFSLLTSQCGTTNFPINGIKEALQVLQTQGIPAQKLVLGLAGYGRTFYIPNGFNPQTGITQMAYGAAPPGGFTDIFNGTANACGETRGYEGIYLLRELQSNGWLTADTSAAAGSLKRGYDSCTQQPYLYSQNYVLVYDDYQSVGAKAQYAKSLGLPGLSFFDVTGFTNVVYQAAVAAGYGSS